MSTTTEQIKERLSIVDVVGGYVKLERAGVNFKARCPFHTEKTPSFFVSPTRNSYHCFGCAKSGDVFTFVQELEGLDFRGALKMLAERAGVVIENEPRERTDERERLFRALEAACTFFERELMGAPEAREYILKRGLTEVSITHWRIGFVAEGWQRLRDELQRQGFLESELERAGLVKRGERSFYDRFRSRIMFPIMDSAGRVVAFSGRIFGAAADDPNAAKYLNSPETELFRKSAILYGFDKAKHSIRKLHCAILVEGQMDLVLAHQAGFTNTVALSGTALTDAQCKLLKRLTDNLLIALDADSAGIAAARRSAVEALSHGLDVKVAALPEGKDPADLICESREEWRRVIRAATHVIEFTLDMFERAHHSDQRAFRREAARAVVPSLASLVSAVERAHFVSLVASRLALPESAIVEEVARYRPERQVSSAAARADYGEGGAAAVPPHEGSEGTLLSEREQLLRRLFGVHFYLESDEALAAFAREFRETLESACGGAESWSRESVRFAENRDTLIFEAERVFALSRERIAEESAALLERFRRAALRERYENAIAALRVAEQAGDSAELERAARECEKLRKEMAVVKFYGDQTSI
jgi:DNA primase